MLIPTLCSVPDITDGLMAKTYTVNPVHEVKSERNSCLRISVSVSTKTEILQQVEIAVYNKIWRINLRMTTISYPSLLLSPINLSLRLTN
jgi:hypothetical protein